MSDALMLKSPEIQSKVKITASVSVSAAQYEYEMRKSTIYFEKANSLQINFG